MIIMPRCNGLITLIMLLCDTLPLSLVGWKIFLSSTLVLHQIHLLSSSSSYKDGKMAPFTRGASQKMSYLECKRH